MQSVASSQACRRCSGILRWSWRVPSKVHLTASLTLPGVHHQALIEDRSNSSPSLTAPTRYQTSMRRTLAIMAKHVPFTECMDIMDIQADKAIGDERLLH